MSIVVVVVVAAAAATAAFFLFTVCHSSVYIYNIFIFVHLLAHLGIGYIRRVAFSLCVAGCVCVQILLTVYWRL